MRKNTNKKFTSSKDHCSGRNLPSRLFFSIYVQARFVQILSWGSNFNGRVGFFIGNKEKE